MPGLPDWQPGMLPDMEEEAPLLAAYFIRELNKALGQNLHVPLIRDNGQHHGPG